MIETIKDDDVWTVGSAVYVTHFYESGTRASHAVDEYYCPKCNPSGQKLSEERSRDADTAAH